MNLSIQKLKPTACAALLAVSAMTTSGPVFGGETQAGVIQPGLVEQLNAWISKNSEYLPREGSLTIELVDADTAMHLQGEHANTGGTLKGLYDEKITAIYLVEPWNPENKYDQSILLHEMIHHRQVTTKHWYCAEAQEWPAYKLQAAFLEENDIVPDFYWPAIVLWSSCSRRDFHAD